MQLLPLPERFSQTRDALHQIAFFVLGPLRYEAVGRMGLQAAPGGFGTPEFDGRMARVEGDMLVYEQADQIASQTISTVRAAAEFVGIGYQADWYEDFHDPPIPLDPDSPLDVDDGAGRALGEWFNFGFETLDLLREQVESDEASEVQLWPEHFDAATELGNGEKGLRASYGASPGDGSHHEPYLYVSPWGEIDRSSRYWNDDSFNGASLGHSALISAADPVGAGLDFLLEGYRVLQAS